MKKLSCLLLAIVFLAGCSTTSSRIHKHAALFDSLPPEQQVQIRAGEVAVGFTEPMVFMALGHPSRQYTRVTAAGDSVIWSYVGYQTKTERQRVQGGLFRVKASDGKYYTVRDDAWIDVDTRIEYEMTRIEFVEGRVTAVEQVSR